LDVSKNTILGQLYCDSNLLNSLDLSANTSLLYLDCGSNQITHLDVLNNNELQMLNCRSNPLTSLDISNNNKIWGLHIDDMLSLFKVCVWVMPFPPTGVELYIENSPNVYFTTDCRGGK
jgi:Leucine-rich repeat (LRR) protein